MRLSAVFLITISAIAMCLSCGSGERADQGEADSQLIPVLVSNAALRTMTLELRTTGSVNAFADAAVISEVAGTIEKLLVERGQRIKEGDIIAVVEHAEASARLQEAQAALQAARAQSLQAEAKLKNVEIEHRRVKTLFDDGVASQQMLDEIEANKDIAVAAREAAVAQIAQAEAAVQQARVFLENHTIRAPISGVITNRFMDEGDKNNPSEPIIAIAQLDKVKITCDFPERDLPSLHLGQKARLEVDAYPGETFPAEVKIISPCVDPASRTVGVELWAPNADGRLRAGMFARVTVLGDPFETLAVPDDALTRMPGTGVEFVFLLDGNRARQTDLKTGYRSEGWTAVTGEVKPGDPVVVQGQNNLKSGNVVRILSSTEQ